MSLNFDCLCLGIVVADHICEPISHLPQAGELVLTPRMHLSIGGCAANVAVDLVRLGRKASVVARIGSDKLGGFVLGALLDAGVDFRYVDSSPTEATSCSLIVNVRGEDRRFIHARGANALLEGNEINPQMLAQTRAVYVGGYCLSDRPTPENIRRLFQTAREQGIKTILDVVVPGPNDYWPFLEPVLPWTDVFLPNDDEARIITGCSEPADQARAFRKAGAEAVVITCGSRGTIAACPQGLFFAPAYPVQLVDGAGSGDAFTAGYIHAMLQSCDVRECVRIGSALGASCVRATGATTGVFTASELDEFLSSHPLSVQPI